MVVPVVTPATVLGPAVADAAVVVLGAGVVLHGGAPRDRGDSSRPSDEPDSHRQCDDDEACGGETHETRSAPLHDVLRIHVAD
jgi:hypothetical protein